MLVQYPKTAQLNILQRKQQQNEKQQAQRTIVLTVNLIARWKQAAHSLWILRQMTIVYRYCTLNTITNNKCTTLITAGLVFKIIWYGIYLLEYEQHQVFPQECAPEVE